MPATLAEIAPYVGTFFCVLILSALSMRTMIHLAVSRGWTATANKRSSHSGIVALGGGGPVVIFALAVFYLFAQPREPISLAVVAGAVCLGLVSLIDDIKPLHQSWRFGLQIAVVAICLYLLPNGQFVISHDWPLLIDRTVTGLAWVWFINLFNFMDGIDGLAGSEIIAISFGIFLVGYMVGLSPIVLLLAAALAGGAAGFLPWNWHKSRIMLGDLGSIPIGFLLGFLLIKLAIEGQLIAALILPLYFVADASYTLLRRALRGEKFWRPHKEHFYQRATQTGAGHDHVVCRIVAANIVFIGAALLSISNPFWAVLTATITLLVLMMSLYNLGRADT